MIATCVTIKVKKEYIKDFIEATEKNHSASIQESGNLRFDILQMPDEPQVFLFYEAYLSENDALLHKQTAHYALWRDTVANWMEEPRKGVKYNMLYPKF